MNFFRITYLRLAWALTPPAKKQKRLDDALAILRFWPDTRVLLELAEQEGIGISLKGALIGSGENGRLRHAMKEGKSYIELAPRAVEDVTKTLIHELRHVWQDKVLGLNAANIRAEENGALLSLLITRVKEADAFAFANLIVHRMNQAGEDLEEAAKMAKEIMARTAAAALDDKGAEEINRHFAGKRKATLDEAKKEISEYFLEAVRGKALEPYDRGQARRYHVLYTHPLLEPSAHAAADRQIDIPALRRVLRVGSGAEAPAYLDTLDDRAFAETVMAGVRPDVREALKLMDAFEAAAKGGLPANDNQALREDIHKKLKAALKP